MKSILSQNDGNIATLNKISRIISGPFEAIWFCENEPSYLFNSELPDLLNAKFRKDQF